MARRQVEVGAGHGLSATLHGIEPSRLSRADHDEDPPVYDGVHMGKDQIIWATLTGIASTVTIPTIVALFRGWAPRSQRHSFNSRWTGVALAFAFVAMLVGTIPLILDASDRVAVRWMNIGFCIGAVGFAIQFASFRWMAGRNSHTGNRA
jgi:MFS family permease